MQSKWQLAIGFNLVVVAVGLPWMWNRVVEGKWADMQARRRAAREAEAALVPTPDNPFAGLNPTEQLAVEAAVNERRAAAGKAPWPYEAIHAEAAAAQWRANWVKAVGADAAAASLGGGAHGGALGGADDGAHPVSGGGVGGTPMR